MNKTIFITGATSGFGKATAIKFAANNFNLILNGRRTDRLQQLKEELEQQYKINIYLLPFDVQNRKEVFEAIESLPNEWKKIDILYNNAGLALGRDYFEEANIDDWETMIDTNVKGLIYVSRAVIPLMIAQGSGHIINMGSIAGLETYEKGNGYCATKAAVNSLSEAMRVDLLRHQIRVTAIHPGAAETEFSVIRFKGDTEKAAAMYQGYQPLTAQDIADTVFYVATVPAHVCINKLEITPTAQACSFYLHKS